MALWGQKPFDSQFTEAKTEVHKGPSPCPRCHGESPMQSAVTVLMVEGNEVTERAGWEGAGRKEGESPHLSKPVSQLTK